MYLAHVPAHGPSGGDWWHKAKSGNETKVMAVQDCLTTIVVIVLLGVRPWLIVVCSTVHNRSFISIAYWRHFIIKSVSWEVSWNHGLVFCARRFAWAQRRPWLQRAHHLHWPCPSVAAQSQPLWIFWCLPTTQTTLGYQFDPSIRWNIVVSRFHLIDGF